jgi:hypothetical protein
LRGARVSRHVHVHRPRRVHLLLHIGVAHGRRLGLILPASTDTGDTGFPNHTTPCLRIKTTTLSFGPKPGRTSSITLEAQTQLSNDTKSSEKCTKVVHFSVFATPVVFLQLTQQGFRSFTASINRDFSRSGSAHQKSTPGAAPRQILAPTEN